MKRVIALALMMASFSTFANHMGSVDSLLSVLPQGTFNGKDDLGVACSVSVYEVNFPAKAIAVQVNKRNSKIMKVVSDGSDFRFVAYKKEFVQTERYYVDDTRTSYVERVVRTVLAGDKQQYVVVSNEVVVNRDRTVEAIDCVVDL